MADGPICDRCQTRAAVATVRQVTPGRRPIVRNLCRVCLAEGRVAPPGATRRGLFDEFLAQVSNQVPEDAGGTPAGVPQPVQQTDITRFFSDATRQLLQRAAHGAAERGSLELDTDHLLVGALGDQSVRRLLEGIDADPAELEREVDRTIDRRERTDVAPELSPGAKRTLLTAYREARELGHDYVGPEHVLLGLAADDESFAGRLLARYGISHVKLRGAVIRGARAPARRVGRPPRHPRSTSTVVT